VKDLWNIYKFYLSVHPLNGATKLSEVTNSESCAQAISHLAGVKNVQISYTPHYLSDMCIWNIINEFCIN
jgi:hypothetical protein